MDVYPALGGSTADYKHFPVRHDKPRRRTVNHIVRAAAKRLAEENNNAHLYRLRSSLLSSQPGQDELDTKSHNQRARLEIALRKELFPAQVRASRSRSWKNPCGPEDESGESLAKSNVPLPSDNARARPPSLEREDAFRDSSTSKGNVRLRRGVPAIYDDDAQVAQLYSMGLLYDDEERDRSESISLNTIHRDEALFTVRPVKRGRKNKSRRHEPLHLNLSFDNLDSNMDQYLTSQNPESFQDSSASHSDVPLRVIYELATSEPSFDVDTSQPPDLMDDALSDYDCLSETELDDVPSQREVFDDSTAAHQPTDAWIMLGDDS